MKITLLVTAAALITAATSFGATPPIVAKPRAVGTIASAITVKVKPGAMAVESITIKPGGTFGWHTPRLTGRGHRHRRHPDRARSEHQSLLSVQSFEGNGVHRAGKPPPPRTQ
jgi:hypothetical protein